MWQRFTERARRVVFFAQEEAARLGENYVGTEHLLLGLVRESDSVAARILDRLGVPLGRIMMGGCVAFTPPCPLLTIRG